MTPSRSMTGDTFVTEKEMNPSQTPTSPTTTESSGNTLQGDAIIEMGNEEDSNSTVRTSSSRSRRSSSLQHDTQPPTEKKRLAVLHRITKPFRPTPDPLDITETNIRKLEETPNGFPRLAAFQSSEANFALYRSFSYLHSRLLLDLQDEITCLEKELNEIDWDDSDDDPDRLRSREIDVARAANEPNKRTRRAILREIRERLMEYDEVLIKARTLESFQKPSDRNYRSVRRYHHNEKPLMDAEMDAIRSKEDTVSLGNGREWASFDGGVETTIGQFDGFLKRVFRLKTPPFQNLLRTPELRAKTSSPHVAYYSSSRIDKLTNVFITFVIFFLLVAPVAIMFHLTSTNLYTESNLSSNGTDTASGQQRNMADLYQRDTFRAVGVLIVFTLVFSSAMSLLTRALRHELFAASAAYCAILVVFIGNFTGPGN